MDLEMRYFVLKPKGDNIFARASRVAMLVYADTLWQDDENRYNKFAEDIYDWVEREGGRDDA